MQMLKLTLEGTSESLANTVSLLMKNPNLDILELQKTSLPKDTASNGHVNVVRSKPVREQCGQ